MQDKLIVLRKITKSFPGTVALDCVDFDLRAGEVHALVGENGAGKSTLIKIISGVYSRSSGEYLFEGRSVDYANPRQAIDMGISVIYQELENMKQLSVAENIYLGRLPPHRLRGFIDFKGLLRKSQEVLAGLGLEINPKSMVGSLSIAEQQLVEIAKALSRQVKVIIMDEPTSYLNRTETEKLFLTIKTIRKQGVGVIYVSHRLREVLDLAGRITVLRDGRKIATVDDVQHIDEREMVKLIIGHDLANRQRSEPVQRKAVLEVQNLSIDRRLQSLSFKLHEGEVLGIAGLTGSGKDELIMSLVGLWPKSSGRVVVRQTNRELNSPHDAVQNGVVYLSEERKTYSIFPALGCRENISPLWLFREYRRPFLSKRREGELARKYVQLLSIKASSIEQKINSLSGGNQQKLIFARLLTIKPKILLLHDPTRGIDVGSKAEIYDIITELVSRGAAIILISSEMQEICNLTNRTIVLCKGKKVAEFVGSEVTMENVFGAATTAVVE